MKSTKLSVFDNKRFVLNDGIYTLAYFCRLKKSQIKKIFLKKKRFSQMITNKK